MGRSIDRIVLVSLLAGALYVFFLNAMGNIPLAAASAFIAMAILKKLSSRIPTERIGRKRRQLSDARTENENLSLADHAAAGKRIQEILISAYGSSIDDTAIYPMLRHPAGGKLTADDICAAWRKLAKYEKAVIVSTAAADESAFRIAERLHDPKIRLIDSQQLIRLIARHSSRCTEPAFRPERQSRTAAIIRAAGKAKAGKCVTTAIAMLLIFKVTGTTVYLIGALILLFIAGVSIRKRRLPCELFS